MAGLYVTGWIKRGPRGVIGTNRTCAQETVAGLWTDFDEGRLTRDVNDHSGLDQALGRTRRRTRRLARVTAPSTPRNAREGQDASRPRVKFVDVAAMVAVANS